MNTNYKQHFLHQGDHSHHMNTTVWENITFFFSFECLQKWTWSPTPTHKNTATKQITWKPYIIALLISGIRPYLNIPQKKSSIFDKNPFFNTLKCMTSAARQHSIGDAIIYDERRSSTQQWRG